MKVTYFYQSGFCIEMQQCVLIFDYWKGEIPVWEKEKPVYVFVSHNHGDHYNPEIFRLINKYESVVYILSEDVAEILPENIWAKYKERDDAVLEDTSTLSETADIVRVRADETYEVDDMTIQTYFSTDEGVAFVVKVCGKCICHFGDLNWWHWIGEDDAFNQWQKKHYQETIQKMKENHYDVVFGPPLDPRLEDTYWYGMAEFLRYCRADIVFPMHFGEEYGIIDRYISEHSPENICMMKIHYKNEVFEL